VRGCIRFVAGGLYLPERCLAILMLQRLVTFNGLQPYVSHESGGSRMLPYPPVYGLMSLLCRNCELQPRADTTARGGTSTCYTSLIPIYEYTKRCAITTYTKMKAGYTSTYHIIHKGAGKAIVLESMGAQLNAVFDAGRKTAGSHIVPEFTQRLAYAAQSQSHMMKQRPFRCQPAQRTLPSWRIRVPPRTPRLSL
jgi:hypothetical protein